MTEFGVSLNNQENNKIIDVKKRRRQSYLDSQKCFPMGRTSGTVTVKTENSLNTSWNSV